LSAYNQNGVASLRSFLVERREDEGSESARLTGRFSDGKGIDGSLNCLIGLNGAWAWFRGPVGVGDDGTITISTEGGKDLGVGDALFLLPAPFKPPIAFALLDQARHWERRIFASGAAASSQVVGTDGRTYRKTRAISDESELEANETLISEGWDHEHCELCYKHIYPQTPYYVHSDGNWHHFLCEFCHDRFAATHSVKELIYPGQGQRKDEAD
jgi:ribosomal protein L24E